jgi:hypothetical protein
MYDWPQIERQMTPNFFRRLWMGPERLSVYYEIMAGALEPKLNHISEPDNTPSSYELQDRIIAARFMAGHSWHKAGKFDRSAANFIRARQLAEKVETQFASLEHRTLDQEESYQAQRYGHIYQQALIGEHSARLLSGERFFTGKSDPSIPAMKHSGMIGEPSNANQYAWTLKTFGGANNALVVDARGLWHPSPPTFLPETLTQAGLSILSLSLPSGESDIQPPTSRQARLKRGYSIWAYDWANPMTTLIRREMRELYEEALSDPHRTDPPLEPIELETLPHLLDHESDMALRARPRLLAGPLSVVPYADSLIRNPRNTPFSALLLDTHFLDARPSITNLHNFLHTLSDPRVLRPAVFLSLPSDPNQFTENHYGAVGVQIVLSAHAASKAKLFRTLLWGHDAGLSQSVISLSSQEGFNPQHLQAFVNNTDPTTVPDSYASVEKLRADVAEEAPKLLDRARWIRRIDGPRQLRPFATLGRRAVSLMRK